MLRRTALRRTSSAGGRGPVSARARRKSGKIGPVKRAPSRKSLAGVAFNAACARVTWSSRSPSLNVDHLATGRLEQSVLRVCALIESALELGVPAALAKHRAEAMPAMSSIAATKGSPGLRCSQRWLRRGDPSRPKRAITTQRPTVR